jgi:hypothetical protein
MTGWIEEIVFLRRVISAGDRTFGIRPAAQRHRSREDDPRQTRKR